MNWQEVKNMLLSAKDDYSQLFEKDRPIANDVNLLMQKLGKNVPSNADFRNPQAMSQWAQAAALNAPMGLMFTGPKSTGWNKAIAKKAQDMLDNGVPADKVWKETMYGRMPDNSMFTEIDDSAATLNPLRKTRPRQKIRDEIYKIEEKNGFDQEKYPKKYYKLMDELKLKNTIGNSLSHNELFSSYPGLKNIELSINDSLPIGGATYYDNLNAIQAQSLNKPVLLHELQHAIQNNEGWAAGGNPSIVSKYKMGEDSTPIELYRRLMGEAQARATQGRVNMNMKDRRANYPLANDMLDDIPLNRLIYHYE